MSLHVLWYGVTDTVVITRGEDELCEIPRTEWQELVNAIRSGDTQMPWEVVKVTLE